MSTITRNQFVNDLSSKHGVIDVNNMSDGLKKTLEANGLSEQELKKIAGPDGQIKGTEEFNRLFQAVDHFEHAKPGNSFETKTETCGGQKMETASGKLYDALKHEVNINRLRSRYEKPGMKEAEPQKRLTKTSDALVVPQDKKLPHVLLDVKHVNQYDLHPDNEAAGDNACHDAAEKQLNDFNKAHHGKTLPLNPPDDSIQVGFREDQKGRLKADPTQAKIAREYIDKTLDQKRPVLVGVSHDDLEINNDKLTDHFVTILGRGYDKDGRLYYQYRDPGATKSDSLGKLYVDEKTGKLFKEGTDKTGYVKDEDWEVTQVRTYKDGA